MCHSSEGRNIDIYGCKNPKSHTQLTPKGGVLLGKLTVQLIKRFPAFGETRSFTATFTKSMTSTYPEPDQSSPFPHPISWKSILILSSHLWGGLPSGLFPPDFPTKTLHAPLPSYGSHAPTISFLLFCDHWNNTWWAVQVMKVHFMYSPSVTWYRVPLRPKYLPHHLTFEHPQPMFVPQCERPSFIPVISGFRREVGANCALRGYYAASSGNFLLTFHLQGWRISTPEDETDRLFLNVVKKLPLLAA